MVKWQIDDDMSRCTAEEVERLLPLVSAQRREQAMRYKHLHGQYCCLRSWEILDALVRETTGKRQANVSLVSRSLAYNEHGKPFLPDGPFFSISHCKEAIAVAVADEPIGIDVEAIRHADEALIERTMNEEERKQIAESDDKDRVFTRLWTRKEAVLKWQGTGIESFEQLQGVLSHQPSAFSLQTFEKEKYIYSIAYGELHCFGA